MFMFVPQWVIGFVVVLLVAAIGQAEHERRKRRWLEEQLAELEEELRRAPAPVEFEQPVT